MPGLAAVNRTGGVSREIRVILDPARLQSLGITASQVNQQLRAINMNAAGGRAEIAGSEQSVRVLGNARYRLPARPDPDLARQRPHGQARRHRHVRDLYAEQRSYAHPERPPGASAS